MTEKLIRDYLEQQLGVPVYLERPETAPRSFVIIEKTSGRTVDYVESATLALQSYAPTLYEAAVLNRRLVQAMEGAVVLPQVSKSQHNSDYNYTDTTRKEYRYQAVFDLVVIF